MMTDKEAPAQRSRAASWHWGVRALLIATAVLLAAAAAFFSVVAEDCTNATTDETVTGPAASGSASQSAQPTASAAPASEAGQATRTTKTTETCARPGLTAVPVVALLLVAGLAVAPWLTKVTVGPVSAEIAPYIPVAALSQDQDGTSAVVDPVAAGRARAAESFLQGVALPEAWSRATLLFLLAPPDPAVLAHKDPSGSPDLDEAALDAEVARVATVVAAAAEAPGQIAERAEDGRTDLAYAAVNAAKRIVAVVVASQAAPTGENDGPDGAAAAPDAAVSGAVLAVGRGWSRVVIDLLLLDDDTA